MKHHMIFVWWSLLKSQLFSSTSKIYRVLSILFGSLIQSSQQLQKGNIFITPSLPRKTELSEVNLIIIFPLVLRDSELDQSNQAQSRPALSKKNRMGAPHRYNFMSSSSHI